MGRSLVHMDDSGEDILLSNTLRNEVKSRRGNTLFVLRAVSWFINSGEAVMSVSTIITLSFLVLHPASATMRLISFL